MELGSVHDASHLLLRLCMHAPAGCRLERLQVRCTHVCEHAALKQRGHSPGAPQQRLIRHAALTHCRWPGRLPLAERQPPRGSEARRSPAHCPPDVCVVLRGARAWTQGPPEADLSCTPGGQASQLTG